MSVMLDMSTFLDCFGGTDGGVSFIKLKGYLEDLEWDCSEGLDPDGSKKELLKVAGRFAKLIREIGEI